MSAQQADAASGRPIVPSGTLPLGSREVHRLGFGAMRLTGPSEVSVDEIKVAQAIAPIASVQNLVHLTDRSSEEELTFGEAEGIGCLPWCPIGAGMLAQPGAAIDAIVGETGATPAQVALAWLLHRSPALLPIPGTSSMAHLEEHCRAATLVLEDHHLESLAAMARPRDVTVWMPKAMVKATV